MMQDHVEAETEAEERARLAALQADLERELAELREQNRLTDERIRAMEAENERLEAECLRIEADTRRNYEIARQTIFMSTGARLPSC